MQNYTIQYNTIQYSTVQYSAVQCSAVQCSAVQCGAVQCSAVQCSAVQCCAVQCSAVQYSTVQYSTAQYNTIHYTIHINIPMNCHINYILFSLLLLLQWHFVFRIGCYIITKTTDNMHCIIGWAIHQSARSPSSSSYIMNYNYITVLYTSQCNNNT